MKKILFDGTATQSNSRVAFHGGGEYAKYMLRAALDSGYVFDVVLSNKMFSDNAIERMLEEHGEIRVFRVENKHDIYRLIDEEQYDVFYSALPASYTDYSGAAKLIGVVHGLRAVELPWDFYRYKYEKRLAPKMKGWMISHCSLIQDYLKRKHISQSHQLLKVKNAQFVTASYHTKNSLLNFYSELQADNISVFYSPFSVEKIELSLPKSNYFLMVSGNRFEKNVYRAVKVFDKLFSENRLQEKKVVITGCGNQSFWKQLKNKDCFELLPYVSTEELERLYEKAFCFVYPSLNEGFGYPPLKAMSYGTPVIASSATSIPEVCDNAACYFSPTNEDDLAARILRITIDEAYRIQLAERGLKRVGELQERQAKEMESELRIIFTGQV